MRIRLISYHKQANNDYAAASSIEHKSSLINDYWEAMKNLVKKVRMLNVK
jgi:hypothetical protein